MREAREKNQSRFGPSLCVTRDCNLSCVYCYQKHDSNARMTLDTAKRCIDWIFNNVPSGISDVEIDFIGGEPLLEFDLIKEIIKYTCSKSQEYKYIFFATTNGTFLSSEMKSWFTAHKDCFWLGLRLDGATVNGNSFKQA